ncbi:MAG TPA: hypothetical protein VI728_10360 [Syntrophales bacterium]|nr:MAG: hypothetical protein UX37_C0024G0006 [Microgenomates group bacterium GW2011_GWA2_46_16]HLE18672.1 hypothetical protein [Syntrophales bacterium]
MSTQSELEQEFFEIEEMDWIDAILLSAGAGSKAVKIQFDNEYQPVNIHTGIIESARPAALIQTSDIEGGGHDALEIDGITYNLIEIQKQNQSIFTILILSKDA